jgi:ABC-type multidrug transport system ATPase subunit
VLVARNLGKQFGNRRIFDDLSFSFKNENILIHGSNGCGKSTLLRMIAGADDCWSGDISLSGVSVRESYSAYTSRVSYVPDKLSFFKELSINEFIKFALKQRPQRSPSKLNDLAKAFSIEVDSMKRLGELSLGTEKKLMLLLSLCSDCALYIFDEPLNGLDRESQKVFLDEVKGLSGKCVLMSSHFIDCEVSDSFTKVAFQELNEFGH